MTYPKWFKWLRKGLLILMCCHGVLLAVDAPHGYAVAQLIWLLCYIPVWIIVELAHCVLRLLNSTSPFEKGMAVFAYAIFLIMNVCLFVTNQSAVSSMLESGYALPTILFQILGSILSYECWYYLPCIILAYIGDWLLTRPKKNKQ